MIHSPASFSRQLSAWNEAKLYTNTFGTQRCCMKLRSMASQLVSSAYVFEVFLLGIRSLVSVQWTPKYMFSWTENFLSSILKTSRICNRIKTFKEQPCFCFNFWNSKPTTLCQEIKWVQKKGTNFLWAPAYSPEPPQSSGVLHLVLRDSFLRQPIRFKETFQQPMRIKQSVGILAITGSKNKHTIGSGRDWTTC